jgi:hypothetical protein
MRSDGLLRTAVKHFVLMDIISYRQAICRAHTSVLMLAENEHSPRPE